MYRIPCYLNSACKHPILAIVEDEDKEEKSRIEFAGMGKERECE
jgi:hypothetical protein